jgi:hypothetical protein
VGFTVDVGRGEGVGVVDKGRSYAGKVITALLEVVRSGRRDNENLKGLTISPLRV